MTFFSLNFPILENLHHYFTDFFSSMASREILNSQQEIFTEKVLCDAVDGQTNFLQ